MTDLPLTGGSPWKAQQTVRAEVGYAYGTIAADLHVFQDAGPVYQLAEHRAKAAEYNDYLRPPSYLLDAKYQIVDFVGRAQELADLETWRDAPGSRITARWLHGPGGQGKSRLAAQFAASSAMVGWKPLTVTHGGGTIVPPPQSVDLRLKNTAGVLLVVDYADRWPLTHLIWLFKNALLHQEEPARLLLLARSQESWVPVRSALNDRQIPTDRFRLKPLPADEAGTRDKMFVAARDSFARYYSLADPGGVSAPVSLQEPDFGLTLAVHMAALVAVDAHVHGCRPPADMAGMSSYLLDRERKLWTLFYENGLPRSDENPARGHQDAQASERQVPQVPGGNGFETSPDKMKRVVFAATMAGPVAWTSGQALLGQLDLGLSPHQLLRDHSICYPPTRQAAVLEPLYPDRLAEDFLALTVPGHDAEYTAEAWAESTIGVVLARQGEQAAAPAWAPRAVTFLTSAARRWPHMGPGCLYPLLRGDPQLAVDAGSAALTALAELDDVDQALLEAIEEQLPPAGRPDLDLGAAMLGKRLAGLRLAQTTDPGERFAIYLGLARRMVRTGLFEETVEPLEACTNLVQELRRDIADADPDTVSQMDAGIAALEAMRAAILTQAGRWDELRTSAQDDGRDEPPVPSSALNKALMLSARVVRQSETGLWRDALASGQSAVAEARKALTTIEIGHPDSAGSYSHAEDVLASCLGSLLVAQARAGRWQEAAVTGAEALLIRRRRAEADSRSLPQLAELLANYGPVLSRLGRGERAMEVTAEAVAILRPMAQVNPVAFRWNLAAALDNLGNRLSDLGRWSAAQEAHAEAVATYREWSQEGAAAAEPGLARSLSNLGINLAQTGLRNEALIAEQEAVAIRRRLADALPTAFSPDLAGSLVNLGNRLAELGRTEEACRTITEAVSMFRHLADANPAVFRSELAAALTNLGTQMSLLGRPGEAFAAAVESVDIRRQLVRASPGLYESELAGSLHNLGIRLAEAGRDKESLLAAEEAVSQLQKSLQRSNSPALQARLANFLSEYGLRLSKLRKTSEALAVTRRAIDIYHRLPAENLSATEGQFACSLRTFARVRITAYAELPEAFTTACKSVSLHRGLAAQVPAKFARELCEDLLVTADALDCLDRPDDAELIRRQSNEGALQEAALFVQELASRAE